MPAKNTINLLQPKPYDEVGDRFIISGWAPTSWLKYDYGFANSIFLDLIDIKGITILGTSIYIHSINWLSKFRKKIWFSAIFQFSESNVAFIKESQGRMTIKLSGQDEKNQSIFIPLIVKGLQPGEGADPEIIKKHGKIEETIRQYEKDLKEYNEAWDKIQEKRKQKSGLSEHDESLYFYSHDWKIAGGILDILGQEEGSNENYPYLEEDFLEKQLEEKYKDAIEWRGPLLRGTICKLDGFEYRLFSHDHDKHFHIIHKGRGINARFSFPEIELINYKNFITSIRSKEKDKLIAFIKKPENFQRLEREFLRREGV